jgi:two-component system CheB/CheR fusion protein
VRSEAIAEHRSFRHEFRVVRADGTIAWIVTRGEAQYDANGAVVRTYGVSADVSDRKRMEAALREVDRRKDEFLATLAHELRNPLAPVRNGLHVLRHSDPASPARLRAQSLMERQLEHMVRLIDDLMDVSRINNGKLELRRERVQLTTVLNSAVDAARPMIEEMAHELTVTLATTAVVVDADLTRLAQVFTNLLNNAAKYTEKGGHIGLAVQRHDGEVWISVSDDGIGMTSEQLPRIFDMFTQVERSLDRARGGLGIGLSLVKRLVEMHGGRVDARSDGPGRGSEFVVRLPVAGDAVEPSPESLAFDAATASLRLRILVVDDNRDAADSLSELLRITGSDVRCAYDGEQGVAMALDFRPEVVLLDIGMPTMDGLEACRRIRAQPGMQDVVLIAITGWGTAEDRRRTKDAGFDHHMIKPVDPDALIAWMRSSVPRGHSSSQQPGAGHLA